MKQISQQQIQAILSELHALNIPVQSYVKIETLFAGLTNIEQPLSTPVEEPKKK